MTMKKLVREALRPDYYPDIENDWKSEHEPWTKNPETNEAMERMLDEYEKTNSLDETDYDNVLEIKWALWIGYNFKKASKSSSGPIPPPKGDMDPRSWGDKEEWGRLGWGGLGG